MKTPKEIVIKHWKNCQFRQHGSCTLSPGGWCYSSKEDLKTKYPPSCPFGRGEVWTIKGESRKLNETTTSKSNESSR